MLETETLPRRLLESHGLATWLYPPAGARSGGSKTRPAKTADTTVAGQRRTSTGFAFTSSGKEAPVTLFGFTERRDYKGTHRYQVVEDWALLRASRLGRRRGKLVLQYTAAELPV